MGEVEGGGGLRLSRAQRRSDGGNGGQQCILSVGDQLKCVKKIEKTTWMRLLLADLYCLISACDVRFFLLVSLAVWVARPFPHSCDKAESVCDKEQNVQ